MQLLNWRWEHEKAAVVGSRVNLDTERRPETLRYASMIFPMKLLKSPEDTYLDTLAVRAKIANTIAGPGVMSELPVWLLGKHFGKFPLGTRDLEAHGVNELLPLDVSLHSRLILGMNHNLKTVRSLLISDCKEDLILGRPSASPLISH